MNFKKLIFIILFVCALGTGEKLFSAAQTPSVRDVEKNNEPDYIFESLEDLGFIPLFDLQEVSNKEHALFATQPSLPEQEEDFLELPVIEQQSQTVNNGPAKGLYESYFHDELHDKPKKGSIVSPVKIVKAKINKDKKRKQSDAIIHSPETFNKDVAQAKKPRTATSMLKKNICDWPGCGKNLTTKNSLNNHKKTHTGEKPFKCEKCGKDFIIKGRLNEHKRIHSGEKPFKCEKCPKSFTRKVKLKTHLKTHADDHKKNHTGENPFKCEKCPKSFTIKGSLNEHKRIHSGEEPFKCEFCNKNFIKKSGLDDHKRTHSGEKPFKCTFCGKKCTQKSNLKAHLKIHTKEKSFTVE